MPLAWAPYEEDAVRSAHRLMRFGLTGWKVQAELPNPINFEAATTMVTEDDVRARMGCGPDAQRHLAMARAFVDAGFDHLALMNAGPDVDGFFEFFADELAKPLREMSAS